MGASNVLWHLGRPELIYLPLLEPQPLSPLIWDVVCISVYLVGSITYLSLLLIPDLALLRDRSPRLRWLYRWLALGWQGTPQQHARLERAIGVMAVAIIPIAVSVHAVVSWVFAMTLMPMWHSAIFGPYFVVGAILSGIAALLVAMALLRKAFHLEPFFRPIHFSNLGLLMLTLACCATRAGSSNHVSSGVGSTDSGVRRWARRFEKGNRLMNRAVTIAVMMCAGTLTFALAAPQDREPWEVSEEARAVENPVAASDDVVEEGGALFEKNCVMCHGETGKGDGPMTARIPAPPDLTVAETQERMTDGEIFYKITVGKPPMRGMEDRLSEDERWMLVHFIRSLQAG